MGAINTTPQITDLSQWGQLPMGTGPRMTGIPTNPVATGPTIPQGGPLRAFDLNQYTNPNLFGEGGMFGPPQTPNFVAEAQASQGGGTPPVEGGWTNYAAFGLGLANVGLDAWGAVETHRMNKFMRDYYGRTQDLQEADFANRARDVNRTLADRARVRASAAGHAAGSTESEAAVQEMMEQWGVSEEF